jgi:CO/xanthine dehydrogenase Mo-binding subunit
MGIPVIGRSFPRIDGEEKVTGRAQFGADVELRGLLHGRVLLSPHAHARIRRLSKDPALAVPGVVAVVTAEDLPHGDAVPSERGRALLARGEVRFAGEPVAVVVAESEAAAQDGLERLAERCEYEALPALIDPETAADPGAPLVQPGLAGRSAEGALHAALATAEEPQEGGASNVVSRVRFSRGDVDRGLRDAEVVVSRRYRTSIVHQAYIEPHVATAEYDPARRRLTVWTPTQGLFYTREHVAAALGLPESSVRVVPMTVGGGFGGKVLLLEPLAGALAMRLRRPVRLTLTRADEFRTGTPAPQSVFDVSVGARRDGTLLALRARFLFDAGALPGAPVSIAALMLGGYYRIPHLDVRGREVLTHKLPNGAYRAPGAPQATFAIESAVDQLARTLGLDPLEFRLRNVARDGDPMPNGEAWPRIGLREALLALQDDPITRGPRGPQSARGASPRAGAAGCLYGVGVAVGGWLGGIEPASACVRLNTDGTVQVLVGSVDISGTATALTQIAAEAMGMPLDRVRIVSADSDSAPASGMSGGSKITYTVGAAVQHAAEDARRQILALAAARLEAAHADLEILDGKVQVKGAPARAVAIADLARLTSGFGAGRPPVFGVASEAITQRAPAFGAHAARVSVDPESGRTAVLEYAVAQDVGRAINPAAVRAQIHGGVAQGIGWALLERMDFDEAGSLATGSFLDYAVPRATHVPSMRVMLVEVPSERGPYGAKGVGEPPVVPVAAAIANGVASATGARVTELPMTPESLVRAIEDRHRG